MFDALHFGRKWYISSFRGGPSIGRFADIEKCHRGAGANAGPLVIPILKINDAAAFKAGVVDRGSDTAAAMKAQGGHYIIRSDKFTSLDGTSPARLIVIAFDSIEKAQAYENSAALKEVTAARLKSTNSLSFIVEGLAN
jgi:uncharacterized protein (DUF1330 family)